MLVGIKKYIVLAEIIFVSLFLISCKKENVRISDYVNIEAKGYDGFAKGEVILDKDRLKKDLADKKIMKTSEAKKLIESLELLVEDTNHIKSKEKVTVKVAEEFADNSYIDFSDFEVTVSGLEKTKLLDAFSCLSLKLEGVSPKVRVITNLESTDEYISSLTFSYDDRLYSVGEEVVISIDVDVDKAGNEGYSFKETQKTYVIGNISIYPNDISQLGRETLTKTKQLCLDTIKSETEDTTKHILWRMTGDNSHLLESSAETLKEADVEKVFYLKEKNITENKENNYLYYIFKAKFISGNSEVTGYFAFEFKDTYIGKDGVYVITANSIENRYVCDINYESLYEELIGSKKVDYDVFEIDGN